MTYHKIRGIEKAICTAEQMIAYNMAFRLHISTGDKYRALSTERAKTEEVQSAVKTALRDYRNAYDYKPGKYDEDAIFSALIAGLADYLEHPFIATDYETIGKAFPCVTNERKKPA